MGVSQVRGVPSRFPIDGVGLENQDQHLGSVMGSLAASDSIKIP